MWVTVWYKYGPGTYGGDDHLVPEGLTMEQVKDLFPDCYDVELSVDPEDFD